MRGLRFRLLAFALCGVAVLNVSVPGKADVPPPGNAAPSAEDIIKIRQCLDAVSKAGSDARACIGIVADRCADSADGGAAEAGIACIRRETSVWHRLLGDRYADLQRSLDPGRHKQLDDVQAVWADYRDRRCALGEALFPNASETAVAAWNADCLLEETGRRAIEIGAILSELGSP